MIIKITEKRAIIINDNSYALAKLSTRKDKGKERQEYWSEYMWPMTLERAINKLVQEFMSDIDMTVSLKEFNAHFERAVEQIKDTINDRTA